MVQRNVVAKECGLNDEQLGSQGILNSWRREDSSSCVSSEGYLWRHNRICDVLQMPTVWREVGLYQILWIIRSPSPDADRVALQSGNQPQHFACSSEGKTANDRYPQGACIPLQPFCGP